MSSIDTGTDIHPDATVGYQYEEGATAPGIGSDGVIRSGTIIYCDVTIGERFQTGHNGLVREQTTIGDDVLLGTSTVIDGRDSLDLPVTNHRVYTIGGDNGV